jgi:solute carrier family 25 (adenine nucleotide translocator) protein 4/5/6/31
MLDFFSGGISGIAAKTVSAPMERVKLLLQTQGTNERLATKYNGIGDCVTRIYREEGVKAFWRGNMANIIRYFPTQALNFSIKDHIQTIFPQVDRNLNPYYFVGKNLLAGGLAGSITSLIVYPLDFARTRLGVDVGKGANERQFSGVKDCISKTYKSDGLKGLYRGVGASVFGIFMYRGLYFGVYDSAKPVVMKKDDSIVKKFFFAQFCVIFSETLAYPTDTVKRMLMLQSNKKEVMYTGAFDCVSKVYKKDGISGFWKGNVSNMMRSVGSSLCLVLYDELKTHRAKLF